VAKAWLPHDPPELRLSDARGPLLQEHAGAALFPTRRPPAGAPGRVALRSLLQVAEHLAARQAAPAVRRRIDWPYLLGLELPETGGEPTGLRACRIRLVQHAAVPQLCES